MNPICLVMGLARRDMLVNRRDKRVFDECRAYPILESGGDER